MVNVCICNTQQKVWLLRLKHNACSFFLDNFGARCRSGLTQTLDSCVRMGSLSKSFQKQTQLAIYLGSFLQSSPSELGPLTLKHTRPCFWGKSQSHQPCSGGRKPHSNCRLGTRLVLEWTVLLVLMQYKLHVTHKCFRCMRQALCANRNASVFIHSPLAMLFSGCAQPFLATLAPTSWLIAGTAPARFAC